MIYSGFLKNDHRKNKWNVKKISNQKYKQILWNPSKINKTKYKFMLDHLEGPNIIWRKIKLLIKCKLTCFKHIN